MTRAHGIDVSFWQGRLNWEVAKPKISFAFIRCAWGKIKDTVYDYNASECRRLNIPFGIYIYIRPQKNLQPQVDTLAKCYSDYKPPLGTWMDCESDGDLNKAQLENFLTKFANRCDGLFGVDNVGVYTRAEWWNTKLPRMDWPKYHRNWDAQYNPHVLEPDVPNDWSKVGPNAPHTTWSFWQYTDKGKGTDYGVNPNVSKSIDLNEYNGTHAEFVSDFNLDTQPPPEPDPNPEPPNPEPDPEGVDMYTWAKNVDEWLRTEHGYDGPQLADESPEPTGYKVRTTADDGLRIRLEPNTTSRIIGALEYGTQVTVYPPFISADGYTWSYISSPKSGYIATEFIEVV